MFVSKILQCCITTKIINQIFCTSKIFYNKFHLTEANWNAVLIMDNIYATHGLETTPYIMCYGETILLIQCHGGVI